MAELLRIYFFVVNKTFLLKLFNKYTYIFLMKFKIFCIYIFLYFLGAGGGYFFSKLLRILVKVTKVANEHLKLPKIVGK